MKEQLSDVKSFISDRLGSPLWLSIIFSWCFLNWEIVFTAVFEADQLSIKFINGYFESGLWGKSAFFPILMGVAYCIASSGIKDFLKYCSRFIDERVSELDRKTNPDAYMKRSEHFEVLRRVQEKNKDIYRVKDRNKYDEPEFQGPADPVRQSEDRESVTSNVESGDVERNPEISFVGDAELTAGASKEIYTSFFKSLTEPVRKSLEDPSSRALMLLVMESLKASDLYENYIDIAGKISIPSETYKKCISQLYRANLIKKKGDANFTLTANGEKISTELRNDPSCSFIVEILSNTYVIAKRQLSSLLQSRSLGVRAAAELVVFTPHIKELFSELEDNGCIEKNGELYFWKGKNS